MNSNDSKARLPRPLEGIRVVECGIWHAGPGGGAILADMGAEVIKVESLDGDPSRKYGILPGQIPVRGEKDDWTMLFEMSNRNKKGICLDTATREGRAILDRLVASADVFLTNFRKTTIPKLGIDYASLSRINPRIIHISVSGYGPEGPMGEVGAYDFLGQAYSGMMFMTGLDEPLIVNTLILDQLTAMTVSHAAVSALLVRERQGHGQALDVSLYGSATWLLYGSLMTMSVMKKNLQIYFDHSEIPPTRNLYKCKDGKWLIGANNPEHKYWSKFCELLGLQQLENDPRYATTEARAERTAELVALVDEVMVTKTREEWLKLFHANQMLFVPIQDVDEVVNDPQAVVNGYMVDMDHPSLGAIRVPGFPFQFGANSTCTGPAPDRGQHTDAVLSDIGFDAGEIAGLRQAGIVK